MVASHFTAHEGECIPLVSFLSKSEEAGLAEEEEREEGREGARGRELDSTFKALPSMLASRLSSSCLLQEMPRDHHSHVELLSFFPTLCFLLLLSPHPKPKL